MSPAELVLVETATETAGFPLLPSAHAQTQASRQHCLCTGHVGHTHTPPGRLIFRCPSPWGQSSHHSAEATENGVVRGPIVPWEGSRLGLAGFMSAVLICVAVPVLGEEGSV